MTYQNPHIEKMTGYVPGEQPDTPDVVKLNTNENPFPPCDAVLDAMRELPADELRRYPNPTAKAFRTVAAKLHNVNPDQLIATNGGDELLRLAITTFVEPGQPVGTTEPSYSLYPVLAQVNNSPTISVPLNDDWSLSNDLAKQMNGAGVQLTFIVNPHAPTGQLYHVDQLAKLADQLEGLLLIDEAYVDFVDPSFNHSTIEMIKHFDNVLILRTLSKGYSLAGLRFGYGIGSPSLIEPMTNKTKDSYNTDILSQTLATTALTHHDQAAQTWQAVRDERTRITGALNELGLPTPTSQSNFVLATVPDHFAHGAKNVYETLKKQRIFVRYFEQERLRDKLRITIGTKQQNDALLDALKKLYVGQGLP